jgi:hypothetical protein
MIDRSQFLQLCIRMTEPTFIPWERTPMAISREPLENGLDKYANKHRNEFQAHLFQLNMEDRQ